MEDLTGLQLGQYRIVAPLGEGGMAAVYKAYQPGMERNVALKILPRHLAADPEFYGRFEQEARLIANLQHVHILPVHDFGEQDGYTYIAMPFIETGTLADLIVGEPLPLKQIHSVTRQVGEALGYAHQRGLIHRDVKPSNILIDEAGNCLLTDFGIAKIVESSVEFTRTGAIIGTPAYMSPEQIKGEAVDGRSDLYALGIVLFEMATGRAPYKAETPPAIFVKHLHDPLPMPRAMNSDIPQEVELVILKCLAKDPEDRYSTLAEMLRALRKAIPDRIVTARADVHDVSHDRAASSTERAPDDLLTSLPETELEPRRRVPAWAIGAIAALGILGAIGGLVVLSGFPATNRPIPIPTVGDSPALVRPTPLNSGTILPPPEVTPQLPAGADSFICEDALGCAVIRPGEPVRVAYLLALSGAAAFIGEDSLRAIELTIADWDGRLLGHDLELVGEDSGCNAEAGLHAAQNVVSDPTILAVIGTSCSSAMRAAMSVLSAAGLSTISPSNTLTGLTLEDRLWMPGYYRVVYPDIYQGTAAAEFAFFELGAGSAATIHDGSDYSADLQAVFAARFEELGGTVSYQGAAQPDQTNMRPVLAEAAATTPDVLYLPVFEPTGSLIVRQAAEFPGLNATSLMGSDGLFVDSFAANAGDNAVGMYLSGPYVTGPRYDDLLSKWEVKYGGPPSIVFNAFAYDATNLLLRTLESVAIRAQDGALLFGRRALRDALTQTSNFQGVTGTLECSSKQLPIGTSHGDCGTRQSLGIFLITEAEVHSDQWPPEVIWTPPS